MEAFKTWEEMSTVEQMACQFWDMYKDAHGFRPRHIDTSGWTEQEFEQEFKELAQVIERENILRNDIQARASHAFEMRMLSLLQMGAKDRAMALRWVHEAEESNGDDEFLCYLLDLPYGYFKETV